MKFKELTKEQLWKLRNEICLNSMFYSDYENSFNFNKYDISDFFDSYIEYLESLIPEEDKETTPYLELDNEDNLWDFFNSLEYIDWVRND